MTHRRLRPAGAIAVGAVALVASGCSSSARAGVRPAPATAPAAVTSRAPSTTVPPRPATATPPAAPAAFDTADQALRSRVTQAGLAGGAVLVVRNGQVVHQSRVGSVGPDTRLAVASSTKWLTAALILRLVEAGKLGLDQPISTWLPEFSGRAGQATLRQLLSHTSGVRDQPCLWDAGTTLSRCVDRLASSALEFSPGAAFSYGNADFHVAGRIAEVVTGTPFRTLFAQQVTDPLGMVNTGYPAGSQNPSPAAGLSTTVNDYSHFLQMLLADGRYQGRPYLSPASIAELQRDQVVGYDTSHDFAVGITRIPTYGLGCWRDHVDAHDNAYITSGNGGNGFYPWIDHRDNSYGIVGVEDRRGATLAVPASRVVVDALQAALS